MHFEGRRGTNGGRGMADYDVVVRNGLIYDGSGGPPYAGDVAMVGDRIAAVGDAPGDGRVEIDVKGLAISPGFINKNSSMYY